MTKPAWFYERQAQEAQAREDYYRNNPPTAPTGAVVQRGATTTLYYRSLTQSDGVNPLIYKVNVLDDLLAEVTAAELGLNTTLGVDEIGLRLRGSGVKPTKLHYYQGAATPTRTNTPWGTSNIKYYDGPIRSAPFSQASGTFSAQDLRTRFDALFGGGGSKLALLGARNGRAWIEFETAPVSYVS